MIIIIFFVSHWFLSLFFQTFFLHRYAAHKMFVMSKNWERFFFLLTFITQGASYLNPKAYAVMHRMHHAYSDTERDPHSPHFFRSVLAMMWHTKNIYRDLVTLKMETGKNFDKDVPEWPVFDNFTDKWIPRFIWAAFYVAIYILFAANWWMFLLLPIHFLMGPVHGAIVNWCGHKYGYVNFSDTKDKSKNTLIVDFLTLGELFQNNHHKYPSRPNFGVRKIEFDPAYPFIKLMDLIGIIKLNISGQHL
jgi:stearoyl-CoA desaturase (delta-9 desaturase)